MLSGSSSVIAKRLAASGLSVETCQDATPSRDGVIHLDNAQCVVLLYKGPMILARVGRQGVVRRTGPPRYTYAQVVDDYQRALVAVQLYGLTDELILKLAFKFVHRDEGEEYTWQFTEKMLLRFVRDIASRACEKAQ